MRHGKPVVIMEPVKGGLLANPPAPVAAPLHAVDPDASPASWALRFSASLPGVVTVLSGMSDMAQMRDNLATFCDFRPLGERERAAVRRAQGAMDELDQIPCTNCRYCTKVCPTGIPIPSVFDACNSLTVYGDREFSRKDYEFATRDAGAKASDCVGCGSCEAACPQGLPIIELLERAAATFE